MNETFDFQKHGKVLAGAVAAIVLAVLIGWAIKGQVDTATDRDAARSESPEPDLSAWIKK